MTTLKDVAKLAHVDVSTVSRALNNTSYVHPDTKARILAAVKELSYQPNVLVRGLRHGKRNTIGVVVPKLTFSIFAEVTFGIEEEARRRGYYTLLCNTLDDPNTEKQCLNRLRNGFVDGIIIAATGTNTRLLRDIRVSGLPVTQIIRQHDARMSSVVVDYVEIGYKAVSYLVEKGCQKIALVNGAMQIPPYQDRYKGYLKAIHQYGLNPITVEKTAVLRGMHYGYDCTNLLIDRGETLDAVLVATDSQGMGALRALKENDLKAPDDIRVLSMTGYRVGPMLETTLTSMELPGIEIGRQAADITIRAIEADADHAVDPQQLLLSASLAVRESTG